MEKDDGALTVTLGQRLFVAMGLLAAAIADYTDDRTQYRKSCSPQ